MPEFHNGNRAPNQAGDTHQSGESILDPKNIKRTFETLSERFNKYSREYISGKKTDRSLKLGALEALQDMRQTLRNYGSYLTLNESEYLENFLENVENKYHNEVE